MLRGYFISSQGLVSLFCSVKMYGYVVLTNDIKPSFYVFGYLNALGDVDEGVEVVLQLHVQVAGDILGGISYL